MKKQIFTFLVIALLTVSTGAMAMKSMDHSKMSSEEGMSMGGNMIMLEDSKVDGVTGSGHLMDVRVKMAEHGMSETHHFMIGFMDEAKKMVSKGQVAVKIESPDGKVSHPIKMMDMNGQFGADITLDQPGMYHFKVGTKFSDGNTRVFHMQYDNS